MKITNESILEEYNSLTDMEKYEYLIDASDLNRPNINYNVDDNLIRDCVSKLWCCELYLYSDSKLINGVCFFITYLIMLGIEPTFYKELGLPAIKGFDVAIKRMID
jgi:sulfur transfer protein SufE